MIALAQSPDADAIRTVCPVCGVNSRHATSESPNYVRCNSCKVVYRKAISYSTSDHWDQEYYSDERVIDYYAKRLSGFKKMVGIIDRLVPDGGRWLDVGCGLGLLLQVAQEQKWQVCGIEPSNICVDLARKRLGSTDVIHGTAEDSILRFNGVTVASFIDVLRHVERPGEALANAYSALEAGGWVVIRDVRADTLRNGRSRESTAKRGTSTWFLQEWNVPSMETALRMAGFRSVHSLPSPTFTETRGSERDRSGGIKKHFILLIKQGLWPASRLIHGITGGRIYLTPNFITLGQK